MIVSCSKRGFVRAGGALARRSNRMGHKFHCLALALVFWVIGSAFAWSQANVMQFAAFPPDPYAEKFMGNHAWKIYATGEIDVAAAKRLETLIADKHIPGASLMFLHSPGGSLVGGMELGRVIRASSLFTYVGQLNLGDKFAPGYCYSACALAFLGGEYRYLTKGSVYGVHRFFWEEHTNADADIAQILSASVVEYIRSMGVDTKIFALASQAGPSDLVTPSEEMLLQLNVINNGSQPAKWTIESIPGAIYLKGEQETALGMTKFMLTCPARGPMVLYAIFDAGPNTDEVMAWTTNWLFFDDHQMQIGDHLVSKKLSRMVGSMSFTELIGGFCRQSWERSRKLVSDCLRPLARQSSAVLHTCLSTAAPRSFQGFCRFVVVAEKR
jgi:hypothetical protein